MMRDLSKPIANVLSIRRHSGVIRAGGRLHLVLLRRCRGASVLGADTLILTTRGRSSGRPRSKPVYYVQRGGRLYIAASFARRDAPPQWYLNLLADPQVTVATAGHRARYRRLTTRTIPVIELTGANPPQDRAGSVDRTVAP